MEEEKKKRKISMHALNVDTKYQQQSSTQENDSEPLWSRWNRYHNDAQDWYNKVSTCCKRAGRSGGGAATTTTTTVAVVTGVTITASLLVIGALVIPALIDSSGGGGGGGGQLMRFEMSHVNYSDYLEGIGTSAAAAAASSCHDEIINYWFPGNLSQFVTCSTPFSVEIRLVSAYLVTEEWNLFWTSSFCSQNISRCDIREEFDLRVNESHPFLPLDQIGFLNLSDSNERVAQSIDQGVQSKTNITNQNTKANLVLTWSTTFNWESNENYTNFRFQTQDMSMAHAFFFDMGISLNLVNVSNTQAIRIQYDLRNIVFRLPLNESQQAGFYISRNCVIDQDYIYCIDLPKFTNIDPVILLP